MTPNDGARPNARDGAGAGLYHDHACRQAWQQLIAENTANGYLVTLGFYCYLDEHRAIQIANEFLKRANRSLFGKRFKNRESLTGMVVLEKKRHSTRSSNSPHFHFMVKADGRDIQAMVKAAERASRDLRYPTFERDRPFGQAITGLDFVDVRKIYDPLGLADYLTKECYRFGPIKDALNIGFVTQDGIEGLSAIGLAVRRGFGDSRMSQKTAEELDLSRYTEGPVEGTKYAEMMAGTGPCWTSRHPARCLRGWSSIARRVTRNTRRLPAKETNADLMSWRYRAWEPRGTDPPDQGATRGERPELQRAQARRLGAKCLSVNRPQSLALLRSRTCQLPALVAQRKAQA